MMLKKMKTAEDLDLSTPWQQALTQAFEATGHIGVMGLVLMGTNLIHACGSEITKLSAPVWQRIAYESDKIAKAPNAPAMARFQASMMLAYANLVVEVMSITANYAMDDELMDEAIKRRGPEIAELVKSMRESIDA